MTTTQHAVAGTRLGRQFHLLWFGQAISQLGDYLPYVSLPLFVAYLSDGTFDLALVYSLETLPALIVGLAGGVLIDRLRLRSTMIVTDLLRAAAFGYLAFMASDPAPEGSGQGLMAVFAVAFAAGTFASFFNGALYSAVPRLVAADRLADANARLAATQGLANVVGPGLAGVLVAAAGFWPTFMINSATFLVSAITLAFVRGIGERAADQTTDGAAGGMLEGLRHLWRERRIRYATLATAGAHIVLGFFEATLVLIADDLGAVTDQQKGFLYATFGAGAIVGSVVIPTVSRRIGLGKTLVSGVAATGVLILGFVNLPFGLAGLFALFSAMIAFQAINISFVTIRQIFSPTPILGRVITASRAVAWSTLPIGALIGALASDRVGFQPIYRSAPLLLVVLAGFLLTTILWSDTYAPPAIDEG